MWTIYILLIPVYTLFIIWDTKEKGWKSSLKSSKINWWGQIPKQSSDRVAECEMPLLFFLPPNLWISSLHSLLNLSHFFSLCCLYCSYRTFISHQNYFKPLLASLSASRLLSTPFSSPLSGWPCWSSKS